MVRLIKGECRSGQTGRVKGALAYAYEGSSPSSPIGNASAIRNLHLANKPYKWFARSELLSQTR